MPQKLTSAVMPGRDHPGHEGSFPDLLEGYQQVRGPGSDDLIPSPYLFWDVEFIVGRGC